MHSATPPEKQMYRIGRSAGIGSLGGILTPQVIGVRADRLGFQAAIMFLVLDAFLLALFGVGALRYAVKKVR